MSVQLLPRGDGGRRRSGLNPAVVLGLVAAASAALGFWFVRYTEPEPGRFQKAIFFALLALVVLELWQALRDGRPITGGRRVRMAGAPAGPTPRLSDGLAAVAFLLLLGGFSAFLWGAVGSLLVSRESDFVWIGFGILAMLFGVACAVWGRGGDAAGGRDSL